MAKVLEKLGFKKVSLEEQQKRAEAGFRKLEEQQKRAEAEFRKSAEAFAKKKEQARPALLAELEELLESGRLNNYVEVSNYDKLKFKKFISLYNRIGQENPILPGIKMDLLSYMSEYTPQFLSYLADNYNSRNYGLLKGAHKALASRKASNVSTVTNVSSVTASPYESRATTPVQNEDFGINLRQAIPYKAPYNTGPRRHQPAGFGRNSSGGGSKRRHRKTRRRSPCKRKTRRCLSRRASQTRRR